MKKFAFRLTLSVALAMLTLHPASARAQNQQEMNRQAEQDFNTADAELNGIYKKLAGNMSKEDLDALKAAQRLWLQFRDAEATYEADLGAGGGSLRPTIYSTVRAALTKARAEQLKQLLNGQ